MEELIEFIQSENDLLDRQIEERRERWNNFWHGFSSYISVVKDGNRPLLGPVMTAERRQEMQMYRKQACITEVRLKTRSREKEFLIRVERSLEEIQRETSEIEMPLRRSGSPAQSSNFTPCLDPPSAVPSTVDYQCNNNAGDTSSSHTTESLVPGESIHIKPVHVQMKKSRSRHSSGKTGSPSRRGSDSLQTSDSEDARDLIVVIVPKIHRRRRESGGSTGSEPSSRPEQKFRQRTGSNSSISSEPVRPAVDSDSDRLSAGKATVRRTGSDSRLRRSGSERSLKRSDSAKSLRRTGSGDIPTAILSESNPRIHKRSGSGDMSSLVSSKQSAINKLTRSYDMSIRSLMSEELSLKTLQPEAKLRSDSEPIEIAQQLLDSKALSPKYLSSSPHTKEPAVKLRGDKPIKKQSPNKDSGPPQPVKAIHTLPPSLPVSRENTFDSVSQKSPTLQSDSDAGRDSRDSRRSSSVSNSDNSPEPKSPLPTAVMVADSLDEIIIGSNPIVNISQQVNEEKMSEHIAQSRTETQSHTDSVEDDETLQQENATRSHPTSQAIEIPVKASCDDTVTPGMTSERLLDAVAFMESHDYETGVKTEPLHIQKPAAMHVWNLMRSSIDSPGFMHLPNKLPPSTGENLAQQWIVDKISQLHSTGEVDIDDWLQNAPDSVKQKLCQILPQDTPNKDVQRADNEEQDMGLSIDDTLRSTSPLPDNEEMPLVYSSPNKHEEEQSISDSDDNSRRRLFLRSNSYTLEKPSVALLIAERANRMSQSGSSPLKSETVPSPEKSESLPMTHNRVEAKHSLPANFGSVSPKTQSTRQRSHTVQPTPTSDIVKAKPASPKTRPTRGTSPSAIVRNKALASKSYIVNKPSAALLDSLNESQKSTIESAISSANSQLQQEHQRGDNSESSPSPEHDNRPDSRTSGGNKKNAQRKLEYFSLDKMAAQVQQHPAPLEQQPKPQSPHHSIKHENPDVPKRAHIKRYLQQLGLAEQPADQPAEQQVSVREAWAETHPNMQTPPVSTTNAPSTSSSSRSSPESVNTGSTKPTTRAAVHQQNRQQYHSDMSLRTNTAEKTKLVDQVRRELTLLKSKYSKKLSPRSKNERPGSAQPSVLRSKQQLDREPRPSTACANTAPVPHKQYYSLQNSQQSQSSTDKNLSQLRERLLYAHKQQGPTSGHVKSFAEKEATPITTSYVPPSIDESISEYSLYGAIHSLTHPRPATALSPNQPDYNRSSSSSFQHHHTLIIPNSARLAAVIKGHLCRRVLATSKVQSIVKTINDCRSLLPARPAARSPISNIGNQPLMSLQDLNFQERLLDQWQAALLDIHEIFFELPVDKRISLISQSEIMEAQSKAKALQKQQQQQTKAKVVRRASNKEQQPPKRRISAVTQKVIDRKKVQKAAADSVATKTSTTNKNATVTLKKAVLAPTFAANSPVKKSSQAISGRVTKTYVRQSPRRSQESPRRKGKP